MPARSSSEPVLFHPRARAEIVEATRYYRERRPGLGADFLAEVRRSAELIRAHPEAAPDFSAVVSLPGPMFLFCGRSSLRESLLEEIRAAGLYEAISQVFAVLPPVRSVGVMGECLRGHGLRADGQAADGLPSKKEKAMRESRFPPGWDEERVRGVLKHYEEQTQDEAVAEDEAAFEKTVVEIPAELLPAVRELIARHQRTRAPDPACSPMESRA